MNINSILLYISDLEVTKKFYEDLGFIKSNEMDNLVSFATDSLTLQCMTKPSVKELEREDVDLSQTKTFFIYVEVLDVDKKYNELIEKGFFPSSEPKDWPWGQREFALKDPDDYVFVFYSKVK